MAWDVRTGVNLDEMSDLKHPDKRKDKETKSVGEGFVVSYGPTKSEGRGHET